MRWRAPKGPRVVLGACLEKNLLGQCLRSGVVVWDGGREMLLEMPNQSFASVCEQLCNPSLRYLLKD